MPILVSKKTRVLVQGITGKEGARAAAEMRDYGTKVLAGVTPGKGGQKVDGVPVYDTVAEAIRKHPTINTSLVVVPGAFVKDAVMEAIAGGIALINVLSEHVPVADVAGMVAYARAKNSLIVGPSSVGIISPGQGKLGSIGSGGVARVFQPGPVGVISKSGGMTAELSSILTQAGIGQSTAMGIGGDTLIGADFVDIMRLFQKDPKTKAVVLFGEVGGTFEEQAAQMILDKKFTKPVIAFVAGKFSRDLPQGTTLGHAGAIVSEDKGSYDSKIKMFKKAGAYLPETLDDLAATVKIALGRKSAKSRKARV